MTSWKCTDLWVVKKTGKNAHAVLIAPNPERAPNIIVPSTVKRDNAVTIILDDGSADGSGMNDSKNRNKPTGAILRSSRIEDGRCSTSVPAKNEMARR